MSSSINSVLPTVIWQWSDRPSQPVLTDDDLAWMEVLLTPLRAEG